MHPLAARVWQAIQRHDLVPPAGRVIAAVSGGRDSVALARLLDELTRAGHLALAGLAHLNHRLRGSASDADEVFCRELASQLRVPIEIEAIDVAGLAKAAKTSVEDAGRRARYTFFERAMERLGADRVAVGHTLDDQAETFLLRLIRGAGPRGLGGIHPRAGSAVRPLLDVTREELHAYLHDVGATFREDESNLDVRIPRNRVRHVLMPLLKDQFSPAIARVLSREAAIAREDARFLDDLAAASEPVVTSLEGNELSLDVDALRAMAPALAHRVIQRSIARIAGHRFVGFDHVEDLMALVAEPDGPSKLDLPGLRVERRGRALVLMPKGPRRESAGEAVVLGRPLPVPGEVSLPESGYAISAELTPHPARAWPAAEHLRGHGDTAVIEASVAMRGLAIRGRKPGDIFQPLGLKGRKKLQDFFVDRKVARAERDLIPLVVDDQDRIVWVAGHAIEDKVRVTDRTEAVVILKLKHLGGLA